MTPISSPLSGGIPSCVPSAGVTGRRANEEVCLVSGDLTIDGNIAIPSNRNVVVFVEGDLLIGDPNGDFEALYEEGYDFITVAEGGFLGFIVRGNVQVASHIGQHNRNITLSSGVMTMTQGGTGVSPELQDGLSDFPNFWGSGAPDICESGGYRIAGSVQGVFIADGQIIIESNVVSPRGTGGSLEAVGSLNCPHNARIPDKKFVGEGTFVGWSGVYLRRDFDDRCSFTRAWNNRHPTESFHYRPDLLINSPQWMWQSLRLRQETV
jgi:hypothetical protein